MSTELSWSIVSVTLDQLVPWEGNPKKSTVKNQAQLVTSSDELGQFQTVAIGPFDQHGKAPVYDGHQRLTAWKRKHGGGMTVQALQASRPLNDVERRKVAIYSRQIGAWDWETLSAWEPQELTAWGFDTDLLADWQRDVVALGEFLGGEDKPPEAGDAEPQIDRAEELREKWGVELGQMWRLPSRVDGQEHRLICGDCTDSAVVKRVMGGENGDLLLIDPPYGIDYGRAGGFNASHGWGPWRENVEWDTERPSKEIITFVRSLAKIQIIWGGNYFTDYLPPTMRWLIWDKGQREFSLADFEMAWSSENKASRIFDYSRAKARLDGKVHPTQKPVALFEWCIEMAKDCKIVVDTFLGSGTTIIAAENLARQCRAVEISPAYVAVALQRYQDAFGIAPELITAETNE